MRNLKQVENHNIKKTNELPKKMRKKDNDIIKENEYYYIYYNEKYEDPPSEDWIMCYKCNLWAHENCNGGASTSKGFLCEFCDK